MVVKISFKISKIEYKDFYTKINFRVKVNLN